MMHNLEIQFNKEIIKKIKSLNFQVDQLGSVLFILFALYEDKIDLLDEFDDFNKQKRAHLLYKELEMRALIQGTNTEDGGSIYVLTNYGTELVEFIKGQFKESVTSIDIAVAGVDQLKEAISENSPESWIDEWLDIFPRGVKSGGKLIRSDKAGCIRKMKVFLREYPYNKDVIMRATKAYIRHKAEHQFAYTTCAIYFIYRVENMGGAKSSDLAAWCDQIIHEKENPENLDILA
jgi:hypothetical protein